MTPDEHVAAAEALATQARDLLRATADEALPERMQAAETARAMAAVGRLLVDLSVVRQTRRDLDDWQVLAAGPALAPVADVTPIKRDPHAGDVKGCEWCGTSLTAVLGRDCLVWVETATDRKHACMWKAPADAPAEAPDQHPRKD